MRVFVPVVFAAALAACSDLVSPDSSESVYALYRIGDDVLPVPAPGIPGTTIVADTLLIPDAVVTAAGAPLTEIRVWMDARGARTRESQRFMATRRADALLVDNCPLGALCLASIVYSTTAFQFVGDSLFEQVPPGSSLEARVYARVTRVGDRPR